jgi:hypothetical protein
MLIEIFYLFLFFYAHAQDAPKKKFMKVTRWEEKLFNVLIDQPDKVTDERKVEAKLNYFYQRLDTQDLTAAGVIGDIDDNYNPIGRSWTSCAFYNLLC